jgi:hypothetical protein
MITLDQVEDIQLGQFLQNLEDLGENGLRDILDDSEALVRLASPNLAKAEARDIAEAALAQLVARRKAAMLAEGDARTKAPEPPIAPLSDALWIPFFDFWGYAGRQRN